MVLISSSTHLAAPVRGSSGTDSSRWAGLTEAAGPSCRVLRPRERLWPRPLLTGHLPQPTQPHWSSPSTSPGGLGPSRVLSLARWDPLAAAMTRVLEHLVPASVVSTGPSQHRPGARRGWLGRGADDGGLFCGEVGWAPGWPQVRLEPNGPRPPAPPITATGCFSSYFSICLLVSVSLPLPLCLSPSPYLSLSVSVSLSFYLCCCLFVVVSVSLSLLLSLCLPPLSFPLPLCLRVPLYLCYGLFVSVFLLCCYLCLCLSNSVCLSVCICLSLPLPLCPTPSPPGSFPPGSSCSVPKAVGDLPGWGLPSADFVLPHLWAVS